SPASPPTAIYRLSLHDALPISKILDTCLVLHAEHSMNASTFSARVTGSALADSYAVVASAVGTLSGPLHGGANEAVLEMLEEIRSEEHTSELQSREKLVCRLLL